MVPTLRSRTMDKAANVTRQMLEQECQNRQGEEVQNGRLGVRDAFRLADEGADDE